MDPSQIHGSDEWFSEAFRNRVEDVNGDHATFAEFMGVLEEHVFYGNGSLSLGRRKNLTIHEIQEIIGEGEGEGEGEEEEEAAVTDS
jgi:hypothetical protein